MDPKIVLVTGANRGIGFAIAQLLAQDPSLQSPTLIIASRKLENAKDAIKKLIPLSENNSAFEPLELDVDDDASISSAVSQLSNKYTHLDGQSSPSPLSFLYTTKDLTPIVVLINNAGIASTSVPLRASFASTLNTNVISIAVLTTSLLPLLQRSPHGARVINISSARGSLTRVTTGQNPPTANYAYSVSKAALNLLTIELGHAHAPDGIEFYVTNPGWCKTGFNGFRGPRDPVEGARSVRELVVAEKGTFAAPGFWEWEEGVGMRVVPW